MALGFGLSIVLGRNPFLIFFCAIQTVSSIYSFFLAMVLYPDVQRKAQEEIDRVIGNDRLPTFADRELLPYVDALAKEAMRWHVVGPIGQVLRISLHRMLMRHRV
jgi:cytochrome P450